MSWNNAVHEKKISGAVPKMASCWQVFRLNFVLFFLYLIGDAFYRWDGFSYYASFSEFLPSVALISILCSIVAVVSSILIWLSFKAFEWFCRPMGWKMKDETLLLFLCCFSFMGTIILVGKPFLFRDNSALQEEWALLLCMIFTASLLTWILRDKVNIFLLLENITPLVWLFGIIAVFSVPLVAYHTWPDGSDTVSGEFSLVSAPDRSQPNILLVTYDALTARDMSVYGYHRDTTPFISEWAKSASLFTRAEAESNITSPTTASLMTGKRVWTHLVYHMPEHSKPIRSDIENMALLLKNNNYYTMAYVENPNATPETLGISQSFHTISAFSPELYYKAWLHKLFGGKIRLYDWIIQEDFHPTFFLKYVINSRYFVTLFEEKTAPLQKDNSPLHSNWFLSYGPPEPFFAWIHVLPPHSPYLPPEPYRGMFSDSPKKRKDKRQTDRGETIHKAIRDNQHGALEIESVHAIRARYDEFIRYCDKLFEDFIDQMNKKDKLENTVVILSSDHGEIFEHNSMIHGTTLYEPETNIPLIIKRPGQIEGSVIHELAEQIDIPATILDLANISVPPWMEGRSLVPLLHGKTLPRRPIFSMNFQKNRSRGHQITKGIIAVWEGDYKLIHDLSEKKSQLFNLRQDPDELNNLFDRETGVGQHLLNVISDNLKKANEKIKNEISNL